TESPGQVGDEPDGRAARHRTRHHLFLRVQGTPRVAPPFRQPSRAPEPRGAAHHGGCEKPAGSKPAGDGATPPRRPAALSRRQGGLQPLRGRTEEVLTPEGAPRSGWVPPAASDCGGHPVVGDVCRIRSSEPRPCGGRCPRLRLPTPLPRSSEKTK